MTNYWEPVEAQWKQNHDAALERLLSLTAETHQLFAHVATAEAITHAPPSNQNTVERVLLRRLGEELRAVELLAGTGHGFQAATLAASLFEQCHFLTYISNNEAKAKEFRTWDNSRYSIGGSIKNLVEASGAIRSWSAERTAEEYKKYQLLCGFKHNNPMFIRTILLPSDPDLYLAQLCLREANWFILTTLGLFVALRFPVTACDTILGRCNLILDEIKENYPVFLHLPRTGLIHRRFEDNEMKRSERALQIWQILISAAHNRQILTYQIVGEITVWARGLSLKRWT